MGAVEIDKFFCSSDEGTRTEIEVNDPLVPGIRAQAEAQAPEDGCVGGAASFTIFVADESGDPIGDPITTTSTNSSGQVTVDLDAGTYVIVEDSSGAWETFTVEGGALTIIEVTNFESGLVKVEKLFCEGDEDAVLFSINGSAVTGFDPDTCVDGDAAFRIDDGDTFTTTDGEALVFAEVGTHTLTEVAPNTGTSAEFDVALTAEGEFDPVTTVRVFDVSAGEGGEQPGEGGTVTVSIMKHLCTDVSSVEEFEVVEAAGAETYPANPAAPLAFTVAACPTIVMTGDVPTADAVSGGSIDFDFSVIDADGTQMLSTDGALTNGQLCESAAGLDANQDGDMTDCLDTSHYSFEVVDGVVVITETDVPDGSAGIGTLRFTPGSEDETALASSIATVESTGVITLDTSMASASALSDGMIMLHVYNFASEEGEGGVAPGTGGQPSQAPRGDVRGSQGGPGGQGGVLPDTAAAPFSGSVPAAVLALLMLSGLGVASYAVAAEVRRRR